MKITVARVMVWVLPLVLLAISVSLLLGWIVTIPITESNLAELQKFIIFVTIVTGIVFGLQTSSRYFLPENQGAPPFAAIVSGFIWMLMVTPLLLLRETQIKGLEDIFIPLIGMMAAVCAVGAVAHFIVKRVYHKTYEAWCRKNLLNLATLECAAAMGDNPWADTLKEVEKRQHEWPLKKVEEVSDIVSRLIIARNKVDTLEKKRAKTAENLDNIIRS